MSKKVLFVIASQDYQDIEYQNTRKVLEDKGFNVEVVSSSYGKAKGKLGGVVLVDYTLSEVLNKSEEYAALIFIGGPGATGYFDSEKAHSLAQKFFKEEKLVAAICIAPGILAKAGILSGRKATIWHSKEDRSPINILKENGADFVDSSVVEDGNIITANGPEASEQFGKKIVDCLSR